METSRVVGVFDEPGKVLGHVFERFEGHRVDGLDLERFHEALSLGGVVGVPATSHGAFEALGCKFITVGLGGILGGFKRSSQH